MPKRIGKEARNVTSIGLAPTNRTADKSLEAVPSHPYPQTNIRGKQTRETEDGDDAFR